MVIRKKRNDSEIGNISGMPQEVLDKYRNDAQLGTILKKERVTSLYALKKKYS